MNIPIAREVSGSSERGESGYLVVVPHSQQISETESEDGDEDVVVIPKASIGAAAAGAIVGLVLIGPVSFAQMTI